MARACLLHSQFTKFAPEIPEALQKSLAIAEANLDEAEIAYSYLAFGYYHSRVTDDYQQALDYFERSLGRYQALGDRFYVAHLLHRLGYCYSFTMDNETYMDYTRQSLDLARQTGDLFNAANALGNLGSGGFATGDYGSAEEYLREAISLGQQMRIPLRLAHETILFALSQLLKGNLHEAREAAAQGIAMAKEILFPLSEAYGLAVLSLCASLKSDPELGHRLAAESLALDTNLFGEFLVHWALATAHIGLGQMEEAWSQIQVTLAISYRKGWSGNMTWLLPLASLVLAHNEQPERAAELLGLYFNHPLRPLGWAEEWALLDQWQARLQDSLGPDRYQAAWERGQSLDLRSTVAALLAQET
jgi:tetratricopeptide (TPR) repeat protein